MRKDKIINQNIDFMKQIYCLFICILMTSMYSLNAQTITKTFPNEVSACSTEIPLEVTITADGSTVPAGMITFDLSGHPNIMIDSLVTGMSDSDVSLSGNVVSYTDPLVDGDEPIWINEFHYNDAGPDEGEFIEIAGAAGTDLNNVTVVLYRSNGEVYGNTLTPSVTSIDDEGNGYGAVLINMGSQVLRNGTRGIALFNNGVLVQFISYSNDNMATITATNGPANGNTSVNVGVHESNSTPAGSSIAFDENNSGT